MKWIRYEADGATHFGILEGDQVEEVSGSPFAKFSSIGVNRNFGEVKLLAPCVPPTFYAAGINYEVHVREAATLLGREPVFPKNPDIGYRAVNAIIAHEEPIIIPKDATERIQYEGELVCVVGKKAKNLSEDEALSCLLGVTIGNDFSERTWQAADRTMWRAKNADTFKPMGPWIETDFDLDSMVTKVRVNGEQTIEFKTNDMIFGVETYIAAMTRYLTLYPGDVIWMGTDGASPNMNDGDVCEIEINGVGILRNPIIKEK